MAENAGKPWSAEEEPLLRELVASGSTLSEIAEKLNRTESAIQARDTCLCVGLRRFRIQRRFLSPYGVKAKTKP